MKKLALILLSAILLIPCSLQAQKKGASNQKGHNIVFTIKGAKDTKVFLAVYFREKLILKDSAAVTMTKSGPQFIFKGDEPYQGGLYKLVSQTHYPYLDFIIDGSQHFSVSCDTTGTIENVVYTGTPQNDEVLAFQRKTVTAQKQMAELHKSLDNAKKSDNQSDVEKYTEEIRALNKEMKNYIWGLINSHPDYLFSKMQRGYQEIEVPDAPVDANGKKDSTFQFRYYLHHYWDNVDLGDSRLLFTPMLEPKLKEYFNNLLKYQEPDTINILIDEILARTEKDTLMYHFFVDWIAYHYESSKILGHDGVFVHLVEQNHMKGKCTWLEDDILRKYEKRAKHLSPILIGKQSQELIIPDTSLTDDYSKWHSSYRMPKPYVILWFYDPDCPTCKKESQKLRVLYDSLEQAGKRNFDVYAVANDSDIERWKRYVKENNYPWLNVGGNKANVDYLDAYNIYESGNPAMFILNEKREIILNRRIEMNSIPDFLEQYEKRKGSNR